jgi:hypothetical protein
MTYIWWIQFVFVVLEAPRTARSIGEPRVSPIAYDCIS